MVNWQLSKQDSPHRGDVIYLQPVRWPVNCFTRSWSMFNLIQSTGKLIMHTSIGHQCCDQLTAVKTGYPLTSITGSGVDPSRSNISLKLFADKWLVFKWSQAQVYFFNSYEICCVFVPYNENFVLKLTSDAKIQPAITGREDSCFWLCSPWSRVGHALRPIFMLWAQLLEAWLALTSV